MKSELLLQKYTEHKAILQEATATGANAYTVNDIVKDLVDPGYPVIVKNISTTLEVNAGETAKVVFIPEKKTPTTASGGDFGADFVAMTPNTIPLTVYKGLNFQWDREYFARAPWDVVEVHAKEALRALEQEICTQELTQIVTNATISVSAGTIGFSHLVTAVKGILDNGYTPDYIIVSPTAWAQLLSDDKVINSLYVSDKPVESGVIGKILGCDVILTQLLTSAKAVIGSKKGLYTAALWTPKLEEYEYPDKDKYGLVASMFMGFKLVLPGAFAKIV